MAIKMLIRLWPLDGHSPEFPVVLLPSLRNIRASITSACMLPLPLNGNADGDSLDDCLIKLIDARVGHSGRGFPAFGIPSHLRLAPRKIHFTPRASFPVYSRLLLLPRKPSKYPPNVHQLAKLITKVASRDAAQFSPTSVNRWKKKTKKKNITTFVTTYF